MLSSWTVFDRVWRNRHLLKPLVLQEFRHRYAGSVGGVAWAFITPALTVLVLWLVMGYGLKINVEGTPFFLVLLCKFLPWLFFVDAAGTGVGAITSRSFLVKKIAFPLELLPLVSIGAGLIVHLSLVGLFLIALVLQGRVPGAQIWTLPYFLISLLLLVVGINLCTSIMAVFHKDFAIAVPSVLNIWFWLTPIVWPLETMPARFQPWLALNPMSMIVEGYNHALLGAPLPPSFSMMTMLFWPGCLLILLVGPALFDRLRPHAADAL